MLIRNFGLFWHQDRIGWGSPGKGNSGTLMGFQTKADGPVDFRKQRGVYALYDEGYDLLYVGQAGYGNRRLYDRLDNHMSGHLRERWQRFSWFGIDPVVQSRQGFFLKEAEPEKPEVNEVLNHLEAILIAAAEPRLNRQGGKFGDAQQYYQWYEEPEDEWTQSLGTIQNQLDKIARNLGV